jgi:hypothetical protein
MFEGLIDQVAAAFGIGPDKVKMLLPMLAGLMFNQSGGFAGFLDRFRQQGMGDIVQSWVGGGPTSRFRPTQVESALGPPSRQRHGRQARRRSQLGLRRAQRPVARHGQRVHRRRPHPDLDPDKFKGLLGRGDGGRFPRRRAAGASAVVRAAGGGMARWLPWVGLIAGR